MSGSPSRSAKATEPWESIILASQSPAAAWQAIFAKLRDCALKSPSASALHKLLIAPDRLLAESAWDMWQSFASSAPRVIDGLRDFWLQPAGSSGTAVLVLDALSTRELSLIADAATRRKVTPTRLEVRGAPVPTETDRFAASLGLPGRASLFNNRPPKSFIFTGEDVHTDVLDAPFVDCIGVVPPKPRLFLWHKWPDEPLIHDRGEQREGDSIVAESIRETLTSDGFWSFVDHLRQGRRLVITGDHGYATASEFSSELKDEASIRLFAGTFGAKRAVPTDDSHPWPRQHIPPPVIRHSEGNKSWLVVLGQRKWKVRGGFPTLCHGGLSLLEAAVPFIELPAS